MYWPEITKDTPLEEIKRIHQQIWQYVVENGKKPATPYLFSCSACEYVAEFTDSWELGHCDICPIAWGERRSKIEPCGELYYQWSEFPTKETAEQIRDIPFKYELEKKGAEE